MTENASPFFIRPYRFDDPDHDDISFPRLDWHRRLLLDDGERVLWTERVEVAGQFVVPGAGAPTLAWALPGPARVTVTDRRLAYVCTDLRMGETRELRPGSRHGRRTALAGTGVATGQIRWQWPSALRILPGSGPAARAGVEPERLLLVCDAVRATGQPGLALSGGSLGAAGAMRELATLVRRAVAEFRLANPGTVELAPPEWDALLARAGTAPFADALADSGRGVDLPGALPVEFAHRDDYYRRPPAARQPVRRPRRAASPGAGWSERRPGSAS
ncbi:hypothetical protein [Plantactinospora sp. CA-290183]|uniref:hypothetical protein n=1 Tax=Plantactinospora sp. CA-290183 TaxID=3240006 RepID=UPI003D9242E4